MTETGHKQNAATKSASIPDRTSTGNITTQLRLRFLTPIVVSIFIAVMVLTAYTYFYEQRELNSKIAGLRTSAADLYASSIHRNARVLQSLMDVIDHDGDLHTLLAKRDRIGLLRAAGPLYEKLNRHYGITHFYFSGPDRVNILRVHKPAKFGDTINRITTLEAERSGAASYGVELGSLGTLTLRFVEPWYSGDKHTLIGFVELGMEIDEVIDSIRELLNLDVYVLIDKKFLNRHNWEDGMRLLGRTPSWDQFQNVVVSLHGRQSLPEPLINFIHSTDFESGLPVLDVPLENSGERRALFIPLSNPDGRKIGEMVMLTDVSNETDHAWQTLRVAAASIVTAAAVLIIFFYWLVGRIGRRLTEDEELLQKLATHDGLTNLYNHNTFYVMIEDELMRSTRYGQPLSLLMIDIDHFKQVNDSHGHQSGDRVLAELAYRLLQQKRGIDRVCRYGGEEIAVILPQTEAKGAAVIAERLRQTVDGKAFAIQGGKTIEVTVSIGVSTYPDNADTAQDLVDTADKALYAAKRGGRNQVRCYTKN